MIGFYSAIFLGGFIVLFVDILFIIRNILIPQDDGDDEDENEDAEDAEVEEEKSSESPRYGGTFTV